MEQPILVPLDGSALAEHVLPLAEAIAGSACQLILLEVGEESDDDLRLLERHGDSCAQLETAVGDPAQEIVQVARDLNVGLIAMTTRGRGASEPGAIGSVAEQVMRRSPAPVLLVRPGPEADQPAAPDVRRIVVLLDGSAVADSVLAMAQMMAERLHAPLHLIAVLDADAAPRREAVTRAMLAEAGVTPWRQGVQTSWQVLHGSAAAAIAAMVQAGDLLIVPGPGRIDAQPPQGGVAETLVRAGLSPVLLVPAPM